MPAIKSSLIVDAWLRFLICTRLATIYLANSFKAGVVKGGGETPVM